MEARCVSVSGGDNSAPSIRRGRGKGSTRGEREEGSVPISKNGSFNIFTTDGKKFRMLVCEDGIVTVRPVFWRHASGQPVSRLLCLMIGAAIGGWFDGIIGAVIVGAFAGGIGGGNWWTYRRGDER